MKKSLVLFISILLFTSCGKSDDEDVYSLNSTVWEETDGSVIKRFTFTDSSCKYELISTTLGITTTIEYTYVLDYPNVYMNPEKSGFANLKGIISEDNMSVVNLSKEIEMATLHKK